jgi:DNA-binding transcriptional LysR family regulator
MEMHQVRYFVAVSRTLNFTRGADECNVTQPSLTRAIKQLEAELGGDLFRRERAAAQLTELGQRMHPLLKQCYEAAVGARSPALSPAASAHWPTRFTAPMIHCLSWRSGTVERSWCAP